ncbi:ergothioneine biosynthesis protein EgtB [soil metagenome]
MALSSRGALHAALAVARRRTLGLLDPLSDADQRAQVSPLMSPPVWDLAHVGSYEELWLLRNLDGRAAIDPSLDDLYDAFEHPRSTRPSLPLLGPVEARDYLARVREDVEALLDRVDLDDASDRLRHRGHVYGMVIQHEHQHAETLLATLQLGGRAAELPAGIVPAPPAVRPTWPDEVRVAGGDVVIGTDLDPWAYDNEQPAHAVALAPFWLDTTPVTNGAYGAFIAAGGYHDRRWWTDDGWSWRCEEGAEAPLFWRRSTGGWERLRFGEWAEVDPAEPVQHVCWYEADAYARWTGRRLPTEHEWEIAATWDGEAAAKRRWPWGDDAAGPTRANLGQRHAGPAPVGSYPAGAAPCGALGLIGDVWEWTSSDFTAWPGTEAFPYREYSEIFYGAPPGHAGYKVLRGGSWATHALAARGTFRNWDHPVRRQIFAGFRTARRRAGVTLRSRQGAPAAPGPAGSAKPARRRAGES